MLLNVSKSQPELSALAHETAVILQAAWHRQQIAMWVLRSDAPERMTGLWWLAQASGILPRHLAEELAEWLRPIYKSEV